MKRFLYQGVSFGLLVFTLLISGCSDFDEIKSRKLYRQADQLLEQGQNDQAEKVLLELVSRYPQTHMAPAAERQLQALRHRREVESRQEFGKILESFRQVLNGYRSMYTEYPLTVEQLDASDYFFDSGYLAGIVDDGFRVYLLLTGGPEGFRAWALKDGKSRGYLIDGGSKVLVPFQSETTLEELKDRYRQVMRKGDLIILAAGF